MKISIECATPKDYQNFEELQKRFIYPGSKELRGTPSVDKETFDDYVARESMMVVYQGDILVGYAFVDGYDDGVCAYEKFSWFPNISIMGMRRRVFGE